MDDFQQPISIGKVTRCRITAVTASVTWPLAYNIIFYYGIIVVVFHDKSYTTAVSVDERFIFIFFFFETLSVEVIILYIW